MADLSKELYLEGRYIRENPTWHIEDAYWKANQILQIINRNHLNPKTICEVGCGAGGILHQLYENMNNNIIFMGYEISPQAFEICKQRKNQRLQFALKSLPEDDRFFDIVLAIDVFEHIEDYFGFLKNLRNKGRYKIFHIPLDMSGIMVSFDYPIKNRQKYGHLHYFMKETALATLKEAGYNILDYFYTNTDELPNNTIGQSLLRLPRRISYKLNKDLAVRIFGGFSLLVLTE